ncbi:PREDICTED: testis-expressed sequence 13A protein-like [Lipotes vexillifer]|uniref:Testis-expressed sequence 13A protein-like n=1 Tax=Lipotes vexillifer TaxID=118797 RepID=A0A340W9M4_LIPVE|nr:PREDICTED: testis-expressed sequence 13A protein-like [Lipotes vexillifer]
MAVHFGDHASGFRHNEVIRFISNEVLMNGGGPDFYVAFCSLPWNEVEDRLSIVVADPQVPCNLKRACAWSALALSVRVGARQQEQQVHWVRQLQKKVEECEAASRALSYELKRLCEEHEEAAAQLQRTRAALQEALDERDRLHGQLVQLESLVRVAPLAHEMVPQPQPEQLGATAWAMDAGEQGKMVAMGAQGMPQSEGQMAATARVVYVPGSQSPWAQVMQPPVPVPQPFPFHVPFPMGFPYSTSLPSSAVTEGAATVAATTIAAVIPENPTPGTCPPGLWAAVGAQEEIALRYDQNCCCQEDYSENLQGEYFENLQGEYSENHQGEYSLGYSRSHSQNEYPLLLQETDPLGKSESHKQEGPENSQGTSTPGGSTSRDVRESPKKQQPQEKKAKQPKGKKASDSQHGGKPASCFSPNNWECPSCKAMNFQWRKACYKCKKVCMAVESGGPDPGQTH